MSNTIPTYPPFGFLLRLFTLKLSRLYGSHSTTLSGHFDLNINITTLYCDVMNTDPNESIMLMKFIKYLMKVITYLMKVITYLMKVITYLMKAITYLMKVITYLNNLHQVRNSLHQVE
jgi:hypothetical protein